jgi:hypothetical protein
VQSVRPCTCSVPCDNRLVQGVRALCVVILAGCGATPVPADDDAGPPADAGQRADVDLPDLSDAGGATLRIDYLDPDHGAFAGGTEVTIRGRGFTEGMTITFGGRAVDPVDLEILDGRRAVVQTPPGDPGPAVVAVKVGTETAVRDDGFRYEALLIDPPQGAVAGGTFVTLKGLGTSFADGDVVLFGGNPLTNLQVVNSQVITGYTPAGFPGDVDVAVSGTGGDVQAADAFSYVDAADANRGGMGGGPIDGALNVTVANYYTKDGVPDALVIVGDPATSTMKGRTNFFGGITFSGPDFHGPVTVTAAANKFERGSMVQFDARDMTIFLIPHPDPDGTPPIGGVGRLPGYVVGSISFGSATGIGTTDWGLVPPPRRATERKRAYVWATTGSIFGAYFDPRTEAGTQSIDFVGDGRTSWDFSLTTRSAALAVVAVAGLYDEADGTFTPFALGVARGLLLGPGETKSNVNVNIDIPLDSIMEVGLDQPPPLDTEGWPGPDRIEARAIVDLGGEGAFALPGSRVTFADGELSTRLGRMAPITRGIGDSSYAVVVNVSSGGGAPQSTRIVRGVRELTAPVTIGSFLPVPRPTNPMPEGELTADGLVITPEGPATVPTFWWHTVYDTQTGLPVWRVFSRGDITQVALPDLSADGIDPTPRGRMGWITYGITVPGLTFDRFNYSYGYSSAYWSAYSLQSSTYVAP